MQAVILVGGEGTRLRPLTSTRPQAGRAARRPAVHGLHARVAARPRRRRRDPVLRLPGRRRCATCSATARARAAAALRRGARAARHRRRAEVRRGAARRALPDAQRRRPHRHRPHRPDRPARARPARAARSALVPVDDPSAYGLVRLDDDRVGAASSSRSRRPDQIDTNLISRRRLRARARRRSTSSRPTATSRSSARSGRSSSATASTASPPAAPTGSTSGRPSATCRATFDILEGNVADRGRERLGDDYLAVATTARSRARRAAGDRRARLRIAAGAHVGALVVLGDDVTVGAGAIVERAVVLQRRRDRRATACCATASSPPARASATGTHRDRRRGARRGRRPSGADNVLTRRRASVPRSDAARRRRSRSEARGRARDGARPRADRGGRRVRPCSTDVLGDPRAPARRAVAGRVGAASSRGTRPGGLIVAGMGGSAIGGALARAALGDHASRPIADRARLRPAAVDDARHDRPVRVATRATPRRRSPATRPPARSARAASSSRAAASSPSWPAPTACRSSRSPAASSRAPRSRT